MRRGPGRAAVAIATAAVASAGSLLVPAAVGPAVAGPVTERAQPGGYHGTVLDQEGEPSPKEWVRFRVDQRQRVVGFRTRVWLHCYLYPNSYYQLPAVVEVPTTKIDGRRVDRTWTEEIQLEDDVETLEGRLQLRFAANGKVRGRLAVDVANCATILGAEPPWVPVRAGRR